MKRNKGRVKLSPRKSKSIFRITSDKVKKINTTPYVPRGGIHL